MARDLGMIKGWSFFHEKGAGEEAEKKIGKVTTDPKEKKKEKITRVVFVDFICFEGFLLGHLKYVFFL